jgi:hypothetical protein
VSSQPFQFKTTDTTFGKVVEDVAFKCNGSFECNGSRSLKDSADNGGTSAPESNPLHAFSLACEKQTFQKIPQ